MTPFEALSEGSFFNILFFLSYTLNIYYIYQMAFKEKLKSFSEIQKVIDKKDGMTLFYFTHPDCAVCSVIKPKIEEFLREHSRISGYHSSLDDDPMIAGQLTIYSIPMVLIYMEGREILREGKFIVMDVLEPKIQRLMDNFGIV
ncbi:MAG: hypothetical protein B6241_12905 [Spirochaetaceae bacterium 4572_59]|nr:MAG: hypothetical protein B6241_12905 [Spirochaetaceae bacterium 4572_59]